MPDPLVASVRERVFAQANGWCVCCQKRRAESMHELVFRSLGGKVTETNSVPVCGDGVRGCHALLQRHEIDILGREEGGRLIVRPNTALAERWLSGQVGRIAYGRWRRDSV